MKLQDLKDQNEAPEWLEESGFKTLSNGYLLPNETPRQMWKRVSDSSAKYLNKPELSEKFFDLFWKGWLCGATPVLSNSGTNRALPISCFSLSPDDTTSNILQKGHELAMLTKNGGGVGIYMGDIRPSGSRISTGGTSEGTIPFIKIYDSIAAGISQGSTRRGAAAVYLPATHGDAEAFLRIRRPEGDPNRQCLNIHHALSVSNEFMEGAISGSNSKYRHILLETYKTRLETGEPYFFFHDNVQHNRPQCYKDNNLTISTSNICLAGDTLVATKQGPQKIKDLVGKEVEIFDGENWVLNNSFKKTGINQKLLRIHLSDGSFVDSTLEHRWFVVPPKYRVSEKQAVLTKTKDLKIGSKISFHFEESHGNVKLKGAYAKGFLIAEGTSIQKTHKIGDIYHPALYIYEPKMKCFDRFKKSVEEIEIQLEDYRADTENEVFAKKDSKNNRYKITGIHSRQDLLPFCREFKKGLNDIWIEWCKQSKINFIAGLFDGDGCYMKKGGGYQIASISRDLLLDVQGILKSLGLKATVSKMKDKSVVNFNDDYGEYNTKEAWRLSIGPFFAYKLSEMVKFERISSYSHKKPNRFCADFSRIVKIEEVPSADVYCTTIPTTSKFALANGLITGNCNEIFLYTDPDHTFVCCLSSMNLAKWEEWKNTDAVYYATWFLEGVLTEFIDKAKHISGFECAIRFSEKSRALGLGVLGWHSLLQSEMTSIDSFRAKLLNKAIFIHMKENALKASQDMAKEYGEPEWCKGYGVRNSHLLAVAPTASNSTISGNVSPGIEPINSNAFTKRSAKGTFLEYNPFLKKLLQEKGKDLPEVWKVIIADGGSVRKLDFLSNEEKDVFKTAFEIDQNVLVDLASDRQKYICQGQSLNLFFSADVDPQYFHEVHVNAWKKKLNGLYYVRSSSVLKSELASKGDDNAECKACEG